MVESLESKIVGSQAGEHLSVIIPEMLESYVVVQVSQSGFCRLFSLIYIVSVLYSLKGSQISWWSDAQPGQSGNILQQSLGNGM